LDLIAKKIFSGVASLTHFRETRKQFSAFRRKHSERERRSLQRSYKGRRKGKSGAVVFRKKSY